MKYETIVCPFCGNGHAHITYEENRVYQMNCPDCHNAIFHRDTSWDNAVSFFKRMVVTDESALRQQETVTNRNGLNEPITLSELRQMDGEPVYSVEITGREEWLFRRDGGFADMYGEFTSDDFMSWDNYGKLWWCYRQKPEEDKHE